jgi:hypothetical protein
MWLRPRPLEKGSYITLKADNFFELLHKQKGSSIFSFFDRIEYVIVLKDEQRTVVSSSTTKEKIETAWNWISENISKSLSRNGKKLRS